MRQSLCYLAIICLSSIIIPNVSGQVEEFNVAQNVYEKNHGESIAAKFFGYVEETKFGNKISAIFGQSHFIKTRDRKKFKK